MAWARRRFDAVRGAIEAEQGAGAASAPPALLLARIEAYADAIGDVEQQLAGEGAELDPLLRRSGLPHRRSAPVQGPTLPSPTRRMVHDSVSKWLCADGVELADDTPFTELGIDSLASVPIALELERKTALPIAPELLFDYQSVNALADYIDARREPTRQG